MRCLKIPRRYLIYCFGFLLSLFFTFYFCSSSSFAVSDLVITSSTSSEICDSCYDSGYRFATLYFDSVSDSSSYSSISIIPPGFSIARFSRIYPNVSSVTFPIESGTRFMSISFGTSGRLVFSSDPPFSSSVPSGSLSITENGTYDVSSYAEAVVDVPNQIIQGDYHDDLTTINQSILICGAILLVIYFFYAIYRMIMRGSHGH